VSKAFSISKNTAAVRWSTFFYITYINSFRTSQETQYTSVLQPGTLTTRPQKRSYKPNHSKNWLDVSYLQESVKVFGFKLVWEVRIREEVLGWRKGWRVKGKEKGEGNRNDYMTTYNIRWSLTPGLAEADRSDVVPQRAADRQTGRQMDGRTIGAAFESPPSTSNKSTVYQRRYRDQKQRRELTVCRQHRSLQRQPLKPD
jgi:hypothetical protein